MCDTQGGRDASRLGGGQASWDVHVPAETVPPVSVLVRPSVTIDVGLVSLEAGDGMLHCHVLEHVERRDDERRSVCALAPESAVCAIRPSVSPILLGLLG